MYNIIMFNLQLNCYNSNMFRPSWVYLQGVHIKLCAQNVDFEQLN
jgi:hypothetical protein